MGSEVEITMSIDESRLLTTQAYIPILDQHFKAVHNLEAVSASVPKLQEDVAREKKRLAAVREKAERTESLKARQTLMRGDQEEMVEQVDRSLEAAQGDPRRCRSAKSDSEMSRWFSTRQKMLWSGRPWWRARKAGSGMPSKWSASMGTRATRTDSERWRRTSARRLIPVTRYLLRQQAGEIGTLNVQVLQRQPSFWVSYLEYLEARRSLMRDQSAAEDLIARGRRAINDNDLDGLKAAVKQLLALLPAEEQQKAGGFGGTTIL